MRRFEIDPDIRKAHTIPSAFYTDESTFQVSIEKIFSKAWHFAGMACDMKSLEPFTLLPETLAEPLLIVRTEEALRCLSNVCTHRGKVLVETPCEASLIRCSYHGRRFGLDGRMLSMPEFEGVHNFPSPQDDLRNAAVGEVDGFVFASVDPVLPLDTCIEPGLLQTLHSSETPLVLTDRKEYEVAAHWALYCENYLEGFHIPFVHHALNEAIDYGTYTTDTFRCSSLQTAYDEHGTVAARYAFVFPNTMINFYPWGVSVNIVRPVRPDQTVVEYFTYVADPSLRDRGAGGDLHTVELEDQAVVESVQRGIRSRFYDRGRYSPTREQGTHHFHRLIAEFMS